MTQRVTHMSPSTNDTGANYTVITADAHAGAPIDAYRDYLEAAWFEEFDAWAATFTNPYAKETLSEADECNWDSDMRLRNLAADGVVAEVIYPNTCPPFYPQTSLLVPPHPTERHEYERRMAGLRAHNRWLAEFCSLAPDRRRGIAQVMLNDIDDAVAEVRWAHSAGLRGGILLPGVPPDSSLPPLWHERYEPLWRVCEELSMPINAHSGSGTPDFGPGKVADFIYYLEIAWFAHRSLWHLMFAGIFDRYPNLKFACTEQYTGWLKETIEALDSAAKLALERGTGSSNWGEAVRDLALTPREYWERNCYVGASFMRPVETEVRHDIGVDRIMWANDFPHAEGTYPYSREAHCLNYADVPEHEVRLMLGQVAAEVYDFDLAVLDPIAAEVGPSVADVATPIRRDQLPVDSFSSAFEFTRPLRGFV